MTDDMAGIRRAGFSRACHSRTTLFSQHFEISGPQGEILLLRTQVQVTSLRLLSARPSLIASRIASSAPIATETTAPALTNTKKLKKQSVSTIGMAGEGGVAGMLILLAFLAGLKILVYKRSNAAD